MTTVTRNIDPSEAQDLLGQPARACISFATELGPACLPIVLHSSDGGYRAGVPDGPECPSDGQEVVLLVDEGVQWFDLRALYIRGRVAAADPPTDAPSSPRWFDVTPTKTVAWDYGRLRAVSDGS